MLDRLQGSGNYIRHGADEANIYSMFRLELPEGGGLSRADVLDVTALQKPNDLSPFGTADHGTRIRRQWYLNETIIAIEEIWLDGDAGTVPPHILSDSLYHFYQKHLGFWITSAEDRVSVAAVPD